ncbi:hypothetical protein ECANGB1_831 [Enterospora canceri]|uniref:Uncharacterized protein n=1 Tax=Enterospora canceri TaxID=1081671 RepID=A0A1Y1S8H7_9MICR|nr:hypothetical protein ECANGB1_831 [Enterospora canceri]
MLLFIIRLIASYNIILRKISFNKATQLVEFKFRVQDAMVSEHETSHVTCEVWCTSGLDELPILITTVYPLETNRNTYIFIKVGEMKNNWYYWIVAKDALQLNVAYSNYFRIKLRTELENQ